MAFMTGPGYEFIIMLMALVAGQCQTEVRTWEGLHLAWFGNDPPVVAALIANNPDEQPGEPFPRFANFYWEVLPQGVEMIQPRVTAEEEVTFKFCNMGPGTSAPTKLWLYAKADAPDYRNVETWEPLPPPDPFPDPHSPTPGPPQQVMANSLTSTAITQCVRKWPNRDRSQLRSTLQLLHPKAAYRTPLLKAVCP